MPRLPEWDGVRLLLPPYLVKSNLLTCFKAPKWYAQYRFYLSILVGTCIIGSLAGCSYYGPVAGHGFLSHDLELIREERAKIAKKKDNMVKGELEAVPTDLSKEGYVTIRSRQLGEHSEGKKDTN
jgi:hypothetical protein